MGIEFKYIYGPVLSWRLGRSLGIDLLSQEDKICNFNCVYCQLGSEGRVIRERKIYVSVENVTKELEKLSDLQIDYITFSGRGEPSLAANLAEAIKVVKLIRKEPVAVLTNSSLVSEQEVRETLMLADFVVVKLDACSQKTFEEVNRPDKKIKIADVIEGIKKFREAYRGRLGLQMMFVNKNKAEAGELAYLSNHIKPEEVQINTPLRPCKEKPLCREEILKIKEIFLSICKNIRIVSVYDERRFNEVSPISKEDTLIRRGKVK